MKSVILILMIFLPVAVMAQEKDSSRVQEQPAAAGSVQKKASPTRDGGGVSLEPSRNTSIASTFGQASNAPSPQKGAPAPPSKPSRTRERPRSEGSMVGYIDNAIVGSQVRIRFDAGFHNDVPDRAEFFYAKCGCYRDLLPTDSAFDPNAPGPGPGAATDLNFQQLYLSVEYAPHKRFSVFTEVPVRWIQPQAFAPGTIPPGKVGFSNQAGLGDVGAGFKLAILASPDHYLTFQLQSYFPSGDASRGLGTNHYSVEPALLYYQRLSKRLAVESQVGDWHPIGGSAGVPTASSEGFSGDVFFYGIGPSYELYSDEHIRFTPVVELVGWRVLSGFQTAAPSAASGTNIVNLKIGARTSFAAHSSIYIGYGRALTFADWYRDIVRVEYRYSF